MPRRRLDLVAPADIAARLNARGVHVEAKTVRSWVQRDWPAGGAKVRPPELLGMVADGRVSVYDWPDVERWARDSGRLV
ncbi:MAG: hypothetical protein JWN10_1460 [Solirubrobacterales bacterium]|nr:hypothetical protein [Solirubrobacterales bacterium]